MKTFFHVYDYTCLFVIVRLRVVKTIRKGVLATEPFMLKGFRKASPNIIYKFRKNEIVWC
jgi:hypothetical protein